MLLVLKPKLSEPRLVLCTGLVSSSGLEGVIKSLKMGKRVYNANIDPVEQENSQSLEMHHLEKLLQMQISQSSGE